MFKHKGAPTPSTPTIVEDAVAIVEPVKDASPEALRALLEKNLKWSQIIYEQNRKINRKLFWYDFMGWLRLLVVAVPLIFALIYLPPIIKNLLQKYNSILQPGAGSQTAETGSLANILKLLPLSPVQQEQLKQILK
ncbi:MAG: hypothetical protein Q7S66_01440 [bacterium]|nr:hypothetical protein [bacterium]